MILFFFLSDGTPEEESSLVFAVSHVCVEVGRGCKNLIRTIPVASGAWVCAHVSSRRTYSKHRHLAGGREEPGGTRRNPEEPTAGSEDGQLSDGCCAPVQVCNQRLRAAHV